MKNDAKKVIRFASIAVLFLFIVGYAFSRSYDLLFGVKIRNVNIIDNTKTTETQQNITGNAKNAVHIWLNGREISIDKTGNFDETISLLSGYNIIEIKAEDKFGNSDKKNYKLIYAPDQSGEKVEVETPAKPTEEKAEPTQDDQKEE